MSDGTVKQINPFTGNEVWAVPGRGLRPMSNGTAPAPPAPVEDPERADTCAFCAERYFETPPEKFRYVHQAPQWLKMDGLSAEQYLQSVAAFRCVANMFEIVKVDYWQKNYGYHTPVEERDRMARYAGTPLGMDHLRKIIDYKHSLKNPYAPKPASELTDDEVILQSESYFGGCHEMIVAQRHYRSDAADETDLCSSGDLSPDGHHHYFLATIEAMRGILHRNRYVRYVSVFQNWLKNAGASYDHLHKQIVGLDEWGASISRQVKMLKRDPNVFNEFGPNFASMHNLLFAENDHALAFVGIGHRFPTIEIFSKSRNARPDEHSPEELKGMSDLVRACHAATGSDISCNEEWYYSPVDSIVKMPWHVLIKWRVNVIAGFEGGTSIYINPMTPLELRDHLVPRLYALRGSGVIHDLSIAEECKITPNPLKYYIT